MDKIINHASNFDNNDVEIVAKEPLYQGFFEMRKYQFKHRLFKGGWSPVIAREVFERGHAVAVLLYDPDLTEFVLIEQFRIGAMPTSDSPWLIEIVAGIVEKGEVAEEVCAREAYEEAGVGITDLYKAMSYLSSPGGTTERIHVYVGKVDACGAIGVHGLDHEGEDILVHRVKEQQAINWLAEGKIDNAASIIALQWFQLNKQKVLDEWNKKL